MILVVGSTGQLGSVIVKDLARKGQPVRALVRPTSPHEHIRVPGVELCHGDLRDYESLDRACEGVDTVISTATVMVPRGKYSFKEDEDAGYKNLLRACTKHGVKQFLFTSILGFPDSVEKKVTALRFKRAVEKTIHDSGIPYTIFRIGPFMDDYFALIGSEIPLRGAEAATVARPFWFTKFYRGRIATLVEDKGIAVIPGREHMRNSFVALDDIARLLQNAVGHPAALNRIFDIGGPEKLTWKEVAGIFSRLLDRPVRTVCTSSYTPFFLLIPLMRLFSEGAANQLSVLWAMSRYEMVCDTEEVARQLGVRLTTAEEFLRHKVSLAAD